MEYYKLKLFSDANYCIQVQIYSKLQKWLNEITLAIDNKWHGAPNPDKDSQNEIKWVSCN
jgi:hypothetical protein